MKTRSNILLILFSPSLFGQPELWKAYSSANSGLPETKLKGQYHFYYNTNAFVKQNILFPISSR